MESISFRCVACSQELKFPAAQAGQKAQCTKCGKEVTIPNGQAGSSPPLPEEEEDDSKKHYDIVPDAGPEKKKAPTKKKKEKKASVIAKKKKSLPDADKWAVARHGLTLMSLGATVWAGIYIIKVIVVLLGCAQGPEYGPLRDVLIDPKSIPPGVGEMEHLDRTRFAVCLVSGYNLLTLSRTVYIILSFATLAQMALFLMGYFTCLVVPPERFGMRGQVLTMISLGIFNVGALIIFRLLPLLGIMPYTLIPYLVQEIPTVDANIGRGLPLHIFWSRAPFWEMLLTIILLGCQYMEYNMGAVFLLSVGTTIKDERVTDSATGLVELGMGTIFTLLTFNLISLVGTSDVLVSLIRVVFLVWSGFIFLYIIRYIMILRSTYAILTALVGDEAEKAAEQEEKEEQEVREGRQKNKKKKKRRDDEEEEDDDDDSEEDEDEEKEKKPKKGKKR